MSRSAILLYWLLLLIPTLLIGIFGWRLLRAEEERIDEAAEAARSERARLIAENIELFFEEIKTGIVTGLSEIQEGEPHRGLRGWQDANPLVRQTFVWAPDTGLVLPGESTEPTGSEAVFKERFQEILQDRQTWQRRGDRRRNLQGEEVGRDEARAEAEQAVSPRQEVFMVEQRARKAARPQPAEEASDSYSLSEPAPARRSQLDMADVDTHFGDAMPVLSAGDSGWLPWNADGELLLIGWVELQPGGIVRGAELEMEAIISRLPPLLSPAKPERETVAIVDHRGETIHATGPIPDTAAIHLPIGESLPDWRLAVYPLPGTSAAGRGFFLLSALLLGVFLTSILSGSFLLFWQAQRHAADARRKSSFVSNVSHELKTPLTTIRMYAELLADDRIRDTAKKRGYLEVIGSEAQRLTRLVNNVLDFSRIEQQRKSYDFEDVDAGTVIAGIAAHQRLRTEEAGVAVAIESPREPVTIRADRDAIEQICLNLLDNAVKYAADGKELTIIVDRNGAEAQIDFLDRGPGIPAAHRVKLFSQFHRVDDSLSAKQPGCGLGLNIARQLARGQNGDLVYQPRPGGGSLFRLTCPLATR